jgi:hypothetical protein
MLKIRAFYMKEKKWHEMSTFRHPTSRKEALKPDNFGS